MKMNKLLVIAGLCTASLTTITSCKKESFDEVYRDPSKVTSSSVERQFSGLQYTFRELVVPTYRNYFVTLAPTIHRYIQVIGWANSENQLNPGAAAITDRWERYYQGLAQFRELEKIYATLPETEKNDKKIFMIAAKIFFFDQTQQHVDIHGSVPWSEAGKLSSNGGDYSISYPKYDKAEDIYSTMLDELKAISTELNSITIPTASATSFKNQDLINSGSIDLWKKYCNSLRLRMLTRVSEAPSFTARATQEINEIISNSTTYPIVLTNNDNIQVDIFNNASDIHSRDFLDALESWNNNIAGKKMIDHMVSNADPRLPFMFEPGAGAAGVFTGLDQSLNSADQSAAIAGTQANPSKIAIYNRSTYSRNQNFPGVLVTASEVQYLLAENKSKSGDNAGAKTHFENGIKESIDFLQRLRAVSNNSLVAAPPAPTTAEVNNYITKIGWGGNIIEKIAHQKWLHFNIIQPTQNWAEVRRLDFPTFTFRVESSDIQKTAPLKWYLPQSEQAFNLENYNTIKDQDNINTKLFWDIR